jgi:diguanylate cyclase (GGDEF)-like protein
MSDTDPKGLWLVRTHYRMRTGAFAMVFIATCFHITGKDYGAWAWSYLVALLLCYPQLMYWLALRSSARVNTALQLLLLDSLLLGGFCATVRFSDWLSFSVGLATLINSAANRGMKSTWETLLALTGGAGIGYVVGGFQFSPHTAWVTVVVCIVGLTAYVLEVGNIAYYRNAQLRVTRGQLRLRERALVDANERLQQSLHENDVLRKDLAVQASRDPLTNLYNRRFLDAALPREILRCEREGKPLALIIMDLDHFKLYNDHYGHAAGDACLKSVCQCIQASAKRASDMAARFGGEEFVLLLPDTHAEDAQAMAEALRLAVETLDLAHQQSSFGRVTLSLGLAISQPSARVNAEQLVRHADLALYAAKAAGRNRSHLATVADPATSP